MRLSIRKAYSYVLASFGSLLLGSSATAFYTFHNKGDQSYQHDDVKVPLTAMSKISGSKESSSARSNVACSFEKSVQAADSTLRQLSTAKETFSDFEAFYKKFVVELNSVKAEHRVELGKFEAKITELNNNKEKLVSQLQNSKEESNKHRDELLSYKKKFAELEWENEKLNHEVTINKSNTEKLRKDKEVLQQEVESLRKKLTENNDVALKFSLKEGESDKLSLMKQEAEELEKRYRQALEDKEVLHEDIVSLQKRVSELQKEYNKNQDELQAQTQNANVRAYKAEIQLQNISRQKESLKKQLEESENGLKSQKDKCAGLEKDIVDLKQTLSLNGDDTALKTRQIETLKELNKTLEIKLETMTNEIVAQEVSPVSFTAPQHSFDEQLLQSRIQEMEALVRSTNTSKDKLEGEVLFAQNTIVELKDLNTRLQDDIQDLKNKLSASREESSALESELFTNINKLTSFEQECHDHQLELKDLSSKLDTAKQRCADLETSYEEALTEKDEFKMKATFAERKVAEMKEIVQQDEDINCELEEKLGNMKNELFKMEGQSKSNLKQMTTLKAELESEKTSKESSKQELIALQNKLNGTERNHERLQRELKIYTAMNDELKKSIALKDKKVNMLSEEVSKLQARIEVVEEEDKDLHEENLGAKNKVKELQKERDVLVQEKALLNAEIQSAYKSVSELQTKVNVYKHGKQELDQQVLLLQEKLNKSDAELEEALKQNALLDAKTQESVSSMSRNNEEVERLRNALNESQRLQDFSEQELHKKDLALEELRQKTMAQSTYVESVHDEHENTKSVLETTQKEKLAMTHQLELIRTELHRVKTLNENLNKQKNQLENEREKIAAKLKVAESSVRHNSELNLQKLLEVEQTRTSKMQKKLEMYKSKLEILQSQTDSSMKDVIVFNEDLECANEKIADLTVNLEKSLDEKNQETMKIFLLESKVSDLEKDLSIANKLSEERDGALSEASMKIAKLESTSETLNKQRNEIKEKLNAANEKNLSQQEEILKLQSKINEQKKSNEALNHVISKNDHVINEQRQNIHSYDAEVIKLRQELRSLQVISEGLKTEKIGYEKRCSAYQQKIQSVEADFFKARENKLLLEQELSIQNLKLNAAESQLSSLKSEKNRFTKELENAQITTREAKQELLKNQNKLRETQRSLENASEDLKDKETVIEKIRDDKNEIETENLILKADIEALRRNIQEGESRVEDLERTLEASISETLETSLTSEFEQDESGLEMKVFEAEKLGKQAMEREKSTKQKLKELRKKLSAKELELRSTQQKNHEICEEAKALKLKSEHMENIHEKLESEKNELKEKLTRAKIAISDLEVRYDFEMKQRNTLESQLNESLKKMNEVRTEVHKLEQDNADKLLTTELADKEFKGRDIELERMKESKRILEDQNEKLSLLFKEKSIEDEKRRTELALLQDELLALQSYASEKEAQLNRCKFEQKSTQEDCQSYLLKISTMEQNIADLHNENCHLNVTIQCLKDASENCDIGNTYSEDRAVEIQHKADKLALEVSRKERTTQELNHRIMLLENELEISRQTAKKLEDKCASLLKQKNDIGQEVRVLKDKERTAMSKSTPIEKALIEKDVASKSKILELEHDYENLQEKQNELLDEIAASNAELSKWQNLYNTATSEKKELEEEVSSFQEEHKTASTKLEEIDVEMQKMISKNRFLEEELVTARQSKIQLETQLNEKEHELYILTNQVQMPIPIESLTKTERFDPWPEKAKMEEDAQRLRQEVKDLQVTLYVTSKERDETKRQMFIVKARENDASLKLKHSEEHIDQLTNELKSNRQKLLSTEMELQKAISEQSKTRGDKQASDSQLILTFEDNTTLKKELSSIKTLCNSYKKELANKSNELDMCTKKMESYAKDVATLKSQMKSIKEEYEKLQNEVNNMQRKVNEKNERIAFLEGALKNTRDSVNLPIEQIRRKARTPLEHDTDSTDVASLLSKISILNAQNEILEQTQGERDTEIRNLQKEIYDLRLKIDHLQQEKSKFEKICLDKSTIVPGCNGNNEIAFDNETERHQNEMDSLKRENNELKVELSRLEAQKVLMEIQDSAYKKLEANETCFLSSKKYQSTRAIKQDDEDQAEFGIERVGKQYSVVIAEIMELSRQLQNYKLDISEWNAHYNQIIVSSERLQSTYHALQALLDDLNASYEEHKENTETSDTAVSIQSSDHVDGKNQYSDQADHNTSETSALDNDKKEVSHASLQDNENDPNSLTNGSSALEYSLRKKISDLESKLETTSRERDDLMRQAGLKNDVIYIVSQNVSETSPECNEYEKGTPNTNNGRTNDDNEFTEAKKKAAESPQQLKGQQQGEFHNSKLGRISTHKDNDQLSTLTDNTIKDLQHENQELKLQVDILSKTDGNSNALIAHLRVMVARLHKELEASKMDSPPGLKNRYSYEQQDRFSDTNNNYKLTTTSIRRNKYKPIIDNASSLVDQGLNPSEMRSYNVTKENKASTMSAENESEKIENEKTSPKEEEFAKEDSSLQSSHCVQTLENKENTAMSEGLFTNSSPTRENESRNDDEKEESFTPQETSSPTTLQENSHFSNKNQTYESTDSSVELVGLSSPEKSSSFNSERSGSAGGRASTSSTSPSGRSSWPYTSAYNSYRSSTGYPSYSKKSCLLTRRNSFTKKYC